MSAMVDDSYFRRIKLYKMFLLCFFNCKISFVGILKIQTRKKNSTENPPLTLLGTKVEEGRVVCVLQPT